MTIQGTHEYKKQAKRKKNHLSQPQNWLLKILRRVLISQNILSIVNCSEKEDFFSTFCVSYCCLIGGLLCLKQPVLSKYMNVGVKSFSFMRKGHNFCDELKIIPETNNYIKVL